MKKLFVMAVPILPGKTPQFKKFINELKGDRYLEFSDSRKRLAVRERTYFQSTPLGDFVVVTLEGNDPDTAFKNFAKPNDEFTKWFSKEVREIHGYDLNSPPSGPLPELLIDSLEEVLQN